MRKAYISTLVIAISLLGVLTGCNSNNSSGRNQPSGYSNGISEQVSEQQPSINTDWQYKVQEDKLNSTKNYFAAILSNDGGLQLSLADMDLTGSGWYNTVFVIAWYDESIPAWNGKSILGVKFPGDTEWRKIPIKCEGHSASFDASTTIHIGKEFINQLSTNKHFTLLHANKEFEFSPSTPLDWSHGKDSKSNDESVKPEYDADEELVDSIPVDN